jgi:phosphatidylserine synthase
MSTKRTLHLIQGAGFLVIALASLARQDISSVRSQVFVGLAVAAAFFGVGLMPYALFRERVHGDRSQTVPGRAAVTIICVVCAWAAFCFYRVLHP